jgi:hypothetical protein
MEVHIGGGYVGKVTSRLTTGVRWGAVAVG